MITRNLTLMFAVPGFRKGFFNFPLPGTRRPLIVNRFGPGIKVYDPGHERFIEGSSCRPFRLVGVKCGRVGDECSRSIVFKDYKKTMEVFYMNTNEMESVNRAIAMANGSYFAYERKSQYDPEPKKKWDKVLRAVCMGCGKTLSGWEVKNHWAYCYSCRKILFPGTLEVRESRESGSWGSSRWTRRNDDRFYNSRNNRAKSFRSGSWNRSRSYRSSNWRRNSNQPNRHQGNFNNFNSWHREKPQWGSSSSYKRRYLH